MLTEVDLRRRGRMWQSGSDLISAATVNGKGTPKHLYYTGAVYQGAESAGSVS